ncbi:hypothetical protein AKO1_014703 [Acrasis kona]|uniref:Uncharacterized protein n=1 Tax=Acrasis kona TaxID=1008807 RepID=A0AAW2Z372_9EUKA
MTNVSDVFWSKIDADLSVNYKHSPVKHIHNVIEFSESAHEHGLQEKRVQDDTSWSKEITALRMEYKIFILKCLDQKLKDNKKLRYPESKTKVLEQVAEILTKEYSAKTVASKFTELSFKNMNISTIDKDFRNMMTNLKEVCLTGNSIECVTNMPQSITIINAFANKIVDVDIASLKDLQCLGLGYNKITKLSFIKPSIPLLSLDLCNNDLINLKSAVDVIKTIPTLKALSLSGNALCLAKHYRTAVIATIPNLVSIDDAPVTHDIRKKAVEDFLGFDHYNNSVTFVIKIVSASGVDTSQDNLAPPPATDDKSKTRSTNPSPAPSKQTKAKPASKQNSRKDVKKGKEEVPPEPIKIETVVYFIEYKWLSSESNTLVCLKTSNSSPKPDSSLLEWGGEQVYTYPEPSLELRDLLTKYANFDLIRSVQSVMAVEKENGEVEYKEDTRVTTSTTTVGRSRVLLSPLLDGSNYNICLNDVDVFQFADDGTSIETDIKLKIEINIQ